MQIYVMIRFRLIHKDDLTHQNSQYWAMSVPTWWEGNHRPTRSWRSRERLTLIEQGKKRGSVYNSPLIWGQIKTRHTWFPAAIFFTKKSQWLLCLFAVSWGKTLPRPVSIQRMLWRQTTYPAIWLLWVKSMTWRKANTEYTTAHPLLS